MVLHSLDPSWFGHGCPSPCSCYPTVSLHRTLSHFGGTGISTSLSSATPFGLTLVPDLPWEDKPSPGNLRLSTEWFLTILSLLMPAFSLDYSPPPLTIWLLPVIIAPLPIWINQIPKLRCKSLAPLNLRRTITRPVSYYALF